MIEEILKDIEENRLTNPRVAVVRTLEALSDQLECEGGISEFYRGVQKAIFLIDDWVAKAKESK